MMERRAYRFLASLIIVHVSGEEARQAGSPVVMVIAAITLCLAVY